MSFRLRLSLLFVATLVAVQIFTALLVYAVARRALIAEGERQLTAGAAAVARQLDDISNRVADNVQVLSLDYALRSAIAQRDQSTVLSALRNHGRRIGADRMLLIGLLLQFVLQKYRSGLLPERSPGIAFDKDKDQTNG